MYNMGYCQIYNDNQTSDVTIELINELPVTIDVSASSSSGLVLYLLIFYIEVVIII